MKRFLFLITICFMSCQSDVINVTMKGTVTNNETNSPMEGVEVSFICWYYGNSADESYTGEERTSVITNNKGEYEIKFKKAAFIELKINKSGFAKVHETKHIKSKNNTINIEMESL